MKERFKFRMYDKEKKIMLYEDSEILRTEKVYEYEELWWANVAFPIKAISRFFDYNSEERFVLQQCTGLKDRNGKLIYEGDIIVIPNQYPFYDYKDRDNKKIDLNETCGKIMGESVLNYIGIVEWIYSSWQYVYHCVNPQKQGISEGINNLLNEIGYEDGQKTEFEIIGNIYENKELLKEEK